MKKNCFIIFPVNLFKDIHHLINDQKTPIFVVEDPRYFTDFAYHKLKLAYHIASMTWYADYLKDQGYQHVTYIKHHEAHKAWYQALKEKYQTITFIDFGDDTRVAKIKKILGSHMEIIPSLNFTLTREEIEQNAHVFRKQKKESPEYHYHFQSFYTFQRKRLNILLNANGTPQGGAWSFDTENRKPYPKSITPEEIPQPYTKQSLEADPYRKKAIQRVHKEFASNYGECTTENFIYPITFTDAKKWLNRFLKDRLEQFGTYQDAVHSEIPFGYHAVISPMMNIGLLPDSVVLEATTAYAKKHAIPLASLEGFIRQIIGWRNYVWALYVLDGQQLATENQHKSHEKINDSYWTATTGIAPIDDIIRKIITTGYAHHIERLMYLGTWFLINSIDPQEVFRIFMEWTIDAYEWVMIPNVTMTSNNSSMMMTRMYINSSNYVLKMSNYKKGPWTETWDKKYRSFIKKHAAYLLKNYATARQVLNVIKTDTKKKK